MPPEEMTQFENDLLNQSQTGAANQKGLTQHLEENYDYAKRVEGAIDGTRKRVAADILSLQGRL